MKITITNAYTCFNKGDAGILLGIIEILKKKYKGEDLEVNVLSFTPDEDKKRYCEDPVIKNVYSSILNPRPYKNTKIGKVKAGIKLIFKMIYVQFLLKFNTKKLRKKYKSIDSICDSDMVIVCGGGFLGGRKYDSLMHVFQIYVDRLLNKKVFIMGTSIEPMASKLVKKCTENVLKKVDYIYAREIITYDYLASFMPNDKIKLIPDMAFMLPDVTSVDKRVQKLREKSKNICGLTVRKWSFPNSTNSNEKMQDYINALCETIDYFYENYKTSFVFVPQVIVENGNDTDVAYVISKRLKNRDALIIIEDDISPIMIKALISNFDVFLGTRMHSNIFATSMKIPTVAIAYEKKTNGIMHTVELDEYVVDINTITFDEVREKLEKSIKNKNKITKHLENKIPQIRSEIMKNIDDIL